MGSSIAVALARCTRTRVSPGFDIRVKRFGSNQWSLTGAFPVKETSAKREGYDRTRLVGTFFALPSYPGCPHCESRNFFKCECGKVACWDGYASEVTCPWCKETGELSGTIDVVSANSDV